MFKCSSGHKSFLPVQLESADWTCECQGLMKDCKEVTPLSAAECYFQRQTPVRTHNLM
jgi:hypothetical protein